MSEGPSNARRVTVGLTYQDATDELHAMASTLAASRPERVFLRRWGTGWAVFVTIPSESSEAA